MSNSTNQVIIPTLDMVSLAAQAANRNTVMGTFEKLLSNVHPRVLRDLVRTIRLEQVNIFLNFTPKSVCQLSFVFYDHIFLLF